MIGSVFGEFTSFAPMPWDRENMSEDQQVQTIREAWGEEATNALIPLFRAAYPNRKTIDLLRLDYIFRLPEIRYLQERSRLNQSTWSYLFNMDQPIDGGNTPWHCCDIPYVFRNIDLVEYPHGPQAEPELSSRIQDQVFRSVMAFASSGNPNHDAIPAWAPSEEGMENTLILDAHTRVGHNFDHALMNEMAKWQEIITRRMIAQTGQIQH